MKQVISVIMVVLLILFISSGCKNRNLSGQGKYISFTLDVEIGYGDFKFESHVYCYDLETKQLSRVGVVPDNSQYPVTAYDRSANKIYYSASSLDDERVVHQSTDQLYVLDLNTGEAKALTNALYAINYIIPTEKEVALITWPLKSSNNSLMLYTWNKTSHDLKCLSWDEDISFWKVYYDPDTGELTASGYSSMEFLYRIGHQDETSFIQPESTIYSINVHDGAHEDLFVIKNTNLIIQTNILSILRKNDEIIAYTKEDIKDGYQLSHDYDIISYDLRGNKTGDYKYNKKLQGFTDFVYISSEGRYIYYIGSIGTNGNALCSYDTFLDETNVIFESKPIPNYTHIISAIVLSDY